MDLHKLNSITKYPSIVTYHCLGERGRLREELNGTEVPGVAEGFAQAGEVYLYEKVDGENARIILLNPGEGSNADYLIGSREELLYAKGDRIGNPYGNIAEFLRPLAERFGDYFARHPQWALTVVYQESYGGKTKAAKNYTQEKTQGYRVFDVFSLNREELDRLLSLPVEKIAEWREQGKQPFYHEGDKGAFIREWSLEQAPLLARIAGSEVPKSVESTHQWLQAFRQTQVGMDVSGRSEGVIARTEDRRIIRKIRFEDYERTLRN